MADDKLPVVPSQPETPGLGCSRRQLVRGAALAACAPALGALVGCARRISPDRVVNAATPLDGQLVLSTTDVRELARAGGAVVVHNSCTNPVLVVNTGTGILAMDALCPHARCEIAWVEEDRQAECPCHGSRFAGDGTVLNGPATIDLPTYPATIDSAGTIVVSLLAGDKFFPAVSNGSVVIDLSDPKYKNLQTPGGAIVGHPNGSRIPIALTRIAAPTGTDSGLVVLSALCTHLNCSVQPLVGAAALHCPCHGSEFALDGKVTKSPAVDSLFPLPFTFQPGVSATTGIVTVELGPAC
jgi:cytochrome b6-f complex iron-sulfur subunit